MTARNLLIGSPIERVEDARMLRGRGQYVADVNFEDQLHAVILRSSIAHGRILSVDTQDAIAMPGVHCVITAGDLGDAVPVIPLRLQPLAELEPFRQPMLANGKVRYVGEPMAVVVADTPQQAEDALDFIHFEIEPLPAIIDRETAESGVARVFDEHDSNVALRWTATRGDVEAAFAAADYVRRETFRVQRHAALFMEPRGFVAKWHDDTLSVWGAAKVAFANRKILAGALKLSEQQLNLIEVDVGGSFGSRGEFYPEDYLIPFAARQVNRPVKWIEDRRDHLMTANHAREAECTVEIAATSDGKILGLKGQAWTNNGAYIRTNGSVAPRNIAQFISGPYDIENIHMTADMLTTNKTPSGTYRGPGRFEGDFARERLIDLMAKDLGIDRIEIRRRNLVRDAQMPYPLATITPYESKTELDSGDNHELLARCLADFDWQAKQNLNGKLIDGRYHGVALSCFIEGGGAGPSEDARIVLETDGQFTVYVGSAAVGQGLETIMAQIAGDALEMPMERICIVHGSTGDVVQGYGSYHSRSTVMGGSAIVMAADELKAKIRTAAADRLGCDESDITLDGEHVRGPASKTIVLSDVSDEPLEAAATFKNSKYTYAYGSLAAHVSVDAETGDVQVLEIVSIKDVGRMINPATLKGQAIGSIVQGLGGALLEHLVYDQDGQLLTGTLADYKVASADCFPCIRANVIELNPSPLNPLGAKGGGEGEIIPIGGVIANAVAQALGDFGVEPLDLPLSPPELWRLVQRAKGGA